MGKLFLLLAFFSSACFAQSGILTPSRYAYDNWSHAGLPTCIVYGTGGTGGAVSCLNVTTGVACTGAIANCIETFPNPWTPPARVQSGSTITCANTAADAGTINTAIAAAFPGSFVLLGSTCDITSNINFATGSSNFSGVSLRGLGPQSTTLNTVGTAGFQFGVCCGGGFSGNLSTASNSASTTSVTITSTSGTPVVGQVAWFNQCDTGYSGSPCTIGGGVPIDPGTIWVCGIDYPQCSQNNTPGGTHSYEFQYVIVTGVTNNGGGSFTVTFSPGLYMPDWSSNRTATLNATTIPFFSKGAALEDMTINIGRLTGSNIAFSDTYGSWLKGIRLIGVPLNFGISLGAELNTLISNSYIFAETPNSLAGADVEPFGRAQDTSLLALNNIITGGNCVWGNGGMVGEVVAFNYCRDTSSLNDAISVMSLNHNPFQSMDLFEGNEGPHLHDDWTHGTNALDSYFRNTVQGSQVPNTGSLNTYGIQIDNYNRFDNILGNAIGGPRTVGGYQGTGGSGFVYIILNTDALSSAGLMRWGNCDVVSSPTCRFVSGEVPNTTQMPAGTFPNATAYQNTTPGNNNLPCSFFLSGYTGAGPCVPKTSGGTGLSFYKVCKTFSSFPTSCSATVIPTFPIAGPEVTGGAYVSGFGADNPAEQAYANLPIDTSFQSSFSITASSWAANVETLTVSLSSIANGTAEHIIGGFQLSGVNASCVPTSGVSFTGRPDNEIVMTASSLTQITYSLPSVGSDPGCTGTLKFPDVRQFDERVFQADNSATVATPTFSPVAGSYGSTQNVTISTATGGATLCYTTDGSTPTEVANACSGGTTQTYTGPVAVASSLTLKAIGTLSGSTDSAVGSAAYTITTSGVTHVISGKVVVSGKTVIQ